MSVKRDALVMHFRLEQGLRLRYLRLQTGHTQKDIGKVLRCSQQRVQYVEEAKSFLGGEEVAILSRFFGISIDFLGLTAGAFVPPIPRVITPEQFREEMRPFVELSDATN